MFLFNYFSDVFPYGIYMLTYEHINYVLENSEWVQRIRQEQLNSFENHKNYLEMSITIISGAIAGNYFGILHCHSDVYHVCLPASSFK